jgi:hypothetical protein
MRRALSNIIDLAFLAMPWSAVLGMSGIETLGGALLCAVGCVVVLGVQVALFLARGRTLGMTLTGLAVSHGRRRLALVIIPSLLGALFLAAFLTISAIAQARGLGEDVTTAAPLAIVVALAIDGLFLVGSRRRTLTDLATGLHLAPELNALTLATQLRRGPNAVDGALLVANGLPALLALGHAPSVVAALVSLGGLLTLGVLEIVSWKRSSMTLGGRALARKSTSGSGGA